jgi:hypothetical protein
MSMMRTPGATPSITALQMPTASSLTSKSVMKPMTLVGCCATAVKANAAAMAIAQEELFNLFMRATSSDFSHGIAYAAQNRFAAAQSLGYHRNQ